MGVVQLQNLIAANLYPAVYYKWRWTDDWIYNFYITPVTAMKTAAPAVGTAVLKLHYGSGLFEDFSSMVDGGLLETFNYCYIQIRGQNAGRQIVLWTGVVPAEEFELLGESASEASHSAEQTLKAYSLEYLLNTRLYGSYAQAVSGGSTVWIDEMQIFNRRHEHGGSVLGNLGDYDSSLGCYVFGHTGDRWNAYQVLVYLIKIYSNLVAPGFYLAISTDLKNYLEQIYGVWDFRQLTLKQAIDSLLSRARGLSWFVAAGVGGNPAIVPFSLLASSVSIGDVTVPANYKKIYINYWSDPRTRIAVEADTNSRFEKILVRSDRIKCCFTAEFLDSSLEAAWSSELETAYKDAAKNTEGYDELEEDEKARLNDSFRAADKFERVFAAFRIPHNFNWKKGSAAVCPKFDNTGNCDPFLETAANYYNADKRILPFLPFLTGYDYSTLTPTNNNPANAEPEYRPLFVAVKDVNGRYHPADNVTLPDSEGENRTFGAQVRPLAREFGFICRFRPAYFLGKHNASYWVGEPGVFTNDIDSLGLDYEDMKATVFVESDQHIQLLYSKTISENARMIIIDIPEAQLWFVTTNTVIDIAADGSLVRYPIPGNHFIRDDRDFLKKVFAAAVSYYSKQRNRVAINVSAVDAGLPLGTLIDNADLSGVGAEGSAVTAVSWTFQKRQTTTIRTDFSELDFNALARAAL